MPSPTGNAGPPSGHSSVASETASAPRLLPGEVVPGTRLRIIERLARGAVGELHRAVHVDLDRPVAIKVLRAPAHAATIERFRHEAVITTRIDSPHVVQVLDYGTLPDGRPYYVMPWLRGASLESVIRQGPMPANRALGLVRMACKGLSAAHALGITHRDVKPENLMLVETHGNDERLVVVDFGLATPSGSIPPVHGGTPTYMAPEQIVGLPTDERADIYALGCVAYELLTGRAPFVAPTIVGVLRQHTDRDPEPLSPLCPELLPDGLETTILRCLEKVPEHRFSSMAELEAALCEVQIASGATTPWDPLPPPEVDPRRRRAIARALYAPKSHRRLQRAALVAIAVLAGAAPFLDPRSSPAESEGHHASPALVPDTGSEGEADAAEPEIAPALSSVQSAARLLTDE